MGVPALWPARRAAAAHAGSGKPGPDPLINLPAAEQIKMVHAVGDPLVRPGKRQAAPAMKVPAQRAVERDQAVAEQALGQVPVTLPDRAGDGVAAHATRQRQRSPAVAGVFETVLSMPVL